MEKKENMDYYKFSIIADTTTSEILLALLSDYVFEAFEETDEGLEAYIPQKDVNGEVIDFLDNLQLTYKFDYIKTLVPHQNWNELWESNFQPIVIDQFCGIRASFHEPIDTVKHEIIINPKMAFGTGHHETTFMCIQAMENIVFEGKQVFDFGCGTGILSILAVYLGAEYVEGVDIDANAVENTIENIEINNTPDIVVGKGGLDVVKANNWDVILANINRNVILDSLESLFTKIKSKGILLISGILEQDKTLVLDKAISVGFELEKLYQKNNWLCMKFVQPE